MTMISGLDVFNALDTSVAFSDPISDDPMPLLLAWFEEARAVGASPNPDAMALATVDTHGDPAARVVLCKEINVAAGYLVFYTNYDSRKARDLNGRPSAAATFHWDHSGRQARVQGAVVRSSAHESDAYFATRPVLSQLGAWASRQSQPLRSREELIVQIAATMAEFGIDMEQVLNGTSAKPIPRPPNWGGYRLWLRSVELWSGGLGRLHERVLWSRDLHIAENHDPHTAGQAPAHITGPWRFTRLQP